MRKLLYILILLPLSFLSQEEEQLISRLNSLSHYKNVKWSKIESKITNPEKIKLITSIYNDATENYCKMDSVKNVTDFFNYYSGVFHFADIDNDKDIDLIFSGMECPAADAGVATIYINQDGNLKKAFSTNGEIREVIKNRSIIIYVYPCCGRLVNTVKQLTVSKDKVSLSAAVSFNLAELNAQFLPSKIKAGKTIEFKFSQEIKMAPQETIFENPYELKSLVIARTKDGAPAKIYGFYIDSAKQKWLFVKLNYEDIIVEDNTHKFSILGWIKEPK